MYLIFTLSIAAALIPQLILLTSLLIGVKPASAGLVQSIAFPIAFISLYGGFYHIFNPKSPKHLYIFLGAVAAVIFAASLSIFVDVRFVKSGLAALNIGFTAFLFIWTLPRLAKRGKFLTTLILNICTAIGTFLFNLMELQVLLIISITLCLATFSVLFVILFDRIIDLMQAVSYSSVTDGLTGLYQKHYFKKKVNEAIAAGEPCAVIFSDIDNFKKLNDKEGHQTGDVMLIFAATVMKEVCEGIGLVGRYGGEEIVALITDGRSDPAIIAEKYRAKIEEGSKEKGYVPITVSVGFSRFNDDIANADEFIRQADDAMYISKGSGKNRVTNFAALRAMKENDDDNPVIVSVAEPDETPPPSNDKAERQDIPKKKELQVFPRSVAESKHHLVEATEILNKTGGDEENSVEIPERRELDPGVGPNVEIEPTLNEPLATVSEEEIGHMSNAFATKDPGSVVIIETNEDPVTVSVDSEHKQQAPNDSGENEIKEETDPATNSEPSTTPKKGKQSSSRTKTKKDEDEIVPSAAKKKKQPETPTSASSQKNTDITITNDQSAPRIIRNPFAKKD
jgi:diguanylate cyclase (GGDEF)-like protein